MPHPLRRPLLGLYCGPNEAVPERARIASRPPPHRDSHTPTSLHLEAKAGASSGSRLHQLHHQGYTVGIPDRTKEMVPSKRNMQSALQNTEVIEEYLLLEVAKGNIRGPFMPGSIQPLHINQFGVIPKRHQPGKWRLITDLSYPEGRSVNDAIDKSICSLSYISVRDVANTAVALGRGALIAKTDIKAAYRLVPAASRQDMVGNEMEGPGLHRLRAAFRTPICSKNIQCDS